MLTEAQREAYDRDGFIVVPDVFSPAEIDELRRVTDDFVRDSARVAANDAVYDLEDSHTPEEPRVRRLKAPHLIHAGLFPRQPQREGRGNPRRICGARSASTPASST